MLSLRLPGALLAFALSSVVLGQDCSTTCRSFGLDFKNDGSYFQNVNAIVPFTAYEDFKGCQNDVAHNILVNPNGTQYECSQTNMQPSAKQQLVICPINQTQLTSGNWAIIVASNNGQCNPINYIRNFQLSVGVQMTSTVTSTLIATTTSTPIVATTITSTSVVTTTGPAVSTTVPGNAPPQTVTKQGPLKITVVTKGVATFTITSTTAAVVATQTATTTANCAGNWGSPFHKNVAQVAKGPVADVPNTNIRITVGAMATSAPKKNQRQRRDDVAAVEEVEQPIARRVEEVVQVRSVEKRHPDSPTTTVVIPVFLSTVTSVAPPVTVTGTTTLLQTSTSTPTITVTSGQQVVTTTIPGPTITNYFWIPVQFVTTTRTVPVTATVTSTICA